MIRANRQQRDFRREPPANFLEAVEIRAVARVINFAALMFEQETAVTPVAVTQRARTPMPARREGHLPIALRKAFPPIQFDDARKTEVLRPIADAALRQ